MGGRRTVAHVVWLERALVAVGILCLGYSAYRTVEARNFQRDQMVAFEERLSGTPLMAVAPAAPALDASGASLAVFTEAPAEERRDRAEAASDRDGRRDALEAFPNVLALLDIPRLNLTAPIMTGDDAETLRVAVGHLPDTPKPWEAGNSALAAHRDGLFRPLRHIRVGDDLRVRTTEGEFIYRVRETRIVMPDDLSVLDPTPDPSLTLITCYPFNFVGNAPKRFIVQADRVAAAGTQ